MPLQFDATLKELVQAHPADWLAMLDQPSSGPVEILTPDLSTLTAFTDIVLRTAIRCCIWISRAAPIRRSLVASCCIMCCFTMAMACRCIA